MADQSLVARSRVRNVSTIGLSKMGVMELGGSQREN